VLLAEGLRSQVAQRTVGAGPVVISPPFFDHPSCLQQVVEPVDVVGFLGRPRSSDPPIVVTLKNIGPGGILVIRMGFDLPPINATNEIDEDMSVGSDFEYNGASLLINNLPQGATACTLPLPHLVEGASLIRLTLMYRQGEFNINQSWPAGFEVIIGKDVEFDSKAIIGFAESCPT